MIALNYVELLIHDESYLESCFAHCLFVWSGVRRKAKSTTYSFFYSFIGRFYTFGWHQTILSGYHHVTHSVLYNPTPFQYTWASPTVFCHVRKWPNFPYMTKNCRPSSSVPEWVWVVQHWMSNMMISLQNGLISSKINIQCLIIISIFDTNWNTSNMRCSTHK